MQIGYRRNTSFKSQRFICMGCALVILNLPLQARASCVPVKVDISVCHTFCDELTKSNTDCTVFHLDETHLVSCRLIPRGDYIRETGESDSRVSIFPCNKAHLTQAIGRQKLLGPIINF